MGKKLRAAAVAATVTIGGVGIYNANDVASEVKVTSTKANDQVDYLQEAVRAAESRHSQAVAESREVTEYLVGITGLSRDQLERHMTFPVLPEISSGTISPALAEKQDAASMRLFKVYPNDPQAVPMFNCTVVKTGENTLTSAAHCFEDVFEDYGVAQGKGAGTMSGYVSSYEYYVSTNPYPTLEDLKTQAVRVTGFNKDHTSTDTAVLSVENDGADWFNSVEPLSMSVSSPVPGSVARVSGYPNNSYWNETAEGIVLGEMPASLVGYQYSASLTVVGISTTGTPSYACNFGASGETMIDATGNAYGDLAYVGRSFDLPGAPSVIPRVDQLIAMEDLFKTRLAGDDYVLCGFAPATPIEPLSLRTDPSFTPQQGK